MEKYRSVAFDVVKDMYLVEEHLNGIWIEDAGYGVGSQLETEFFVKRKNQLHEMKEVRDDPILTKAEKMEELKAIKGRYSGK